MLIANPGRLRILMALAAQGEQEFVHLRARTKLTDGNLCTHVRRLASGGLVEVAKSFRDGKPVTRLSLTSHGRGQLEAHARELIDALGLDAAPRGLPTPIDRPPVEQQQDDDWID